MKAEQFAFELKILTPSKDAYVELGYPEGSIPQKLKAYECLPLSIANNESNNNNALLVLISNYDCSNVEIGVVSFFKDMIENDDYFIIVTLNSISSL